MFCRLGWLALWGALLLVQGTDAEAQVVSAAATTGREADMVRQWYRDYLGREPGPELVAWVRLLQQGMSPIDAQATILGSDELFEQQGKDPAAFITATLESVTWTSPDEVTFRRWLVRYQALRGDRVTLAREVLLASQAENTQAQPIDLATAILADSQSLARLAQRELAGTLTGWQLSLRCAALTDAADGMRRALMLRTANPDQVRQSHAELLAAYAAVQEILFRIPGAAPQSSAAARRIGGQIGDLGDLLRIDVLPPEEETDYDPRALLQYSAGVSRGVRSVIQLFESQSNLSLAHRSALRDLAQLEADVEQFTALVRRGVSLDRLRWENDEINQRAEALRGPLLSGSPPLFTRVLWLSIESGLSQLRQSLRDAGPSVPVPPRPGPMPPLPPPRPEAYEPLIRMIDGTIGHMDTFSAAVSPLAYRIPEVPAIARQLRTARTKLLELRREAERGESASRLREMQRLAFLEFRLASDPWAQVVLKYRLAGLPTLARVEAGMREISAELRSEVPPPGGGPRPTRPLPPRPQPPPEPPPPDRKIAELVSSMQDRLNKVDQQVTPLQRFNEARTILNNSRQMASYGRRIVELVAGGRRPSELNRTIAAMQLLSERLDSDTRELDRKLHDAKSKADEDRASIVRREWLRARSVFRDLQDAVGR